MTAALAHQEGNVPKTLRIAEDLQLPLAAVTERLAFLGMSGGGKTYAAMKLAELMLDVGAQVVALDPVGPWWGLQASADGKRAGFPIYVFGGIHGNRPLVPSAGPLMADLLVEKGISAVLDVSDFTLGQMHRFVSEFAERFFDRKKRAATPMHLFLEEAHNFIPQVLPPGDPGAAVMMHRMDRIVRVGRNYGVGTSIISQQPQAISKRCLNQARTLFAFASGGKQERKAILDWFADKSTADTDALFDLLKKLEPGVAHVTSTWLKVEGRQVRIAKKVTFDSSKTPEFGEVLPKPKVLAEVDIAALDEAMAEVTAEAERDDPKPLRKALAERDRRIAELERELRAGKLVSDALAATPAKAPPPAIGKAEVTRIEKALDRLARAEEVAGGEMAATAKALEARLRGEVDRLGRLADHLAQARQVVVSEAGNLRTALARATGAAAAPRPAAAPPPARRPAAAPAPRAAASTVSDRHRRLSVVDGPPEGGIGAGERRVLTAVAQHAEGVTREQLTVLTGYKRSSRDTYLQRLRGRGLVVDGERITATAAGVAALGPDFEPLPTGPELLAHWRSRLPAGELACLEVLVAAYPEAVAREDVGERTTPRYLRSSRDTYLQRLRSRQLITEPARGQVRAAETLFEA